MSFYYMINYLNQTRMVVKSCLVSIFFVYLYHFNCQNEGTDFGDASVKSTISFAWTRNKPMGSDRGHLMMLFTNHLR